MVLFRLILLLIFLRFQFLYSPAWPYTCLNISISCVIESGFAMSMVVEISSTEFLSSSAIW